MGSGARGAAASVQSERVRLRVAAEGSPADRHRNFTGVVHEQGRRQPDGSIDLPLQLHRRVDSFVNRIDGIHQAGAKRD
jgi:hypothetical protein